MTHPASRSNCCANEKPNSAGGCDNCHPIHPPDYKPSETEHRIAFLTDCLNSVVAEAFTPLYYQRSGEPFWNEEKNREYIDRGVNWGLKKLLGEEEDYWERTEPYEKFKADQEGFLSEPHCGDCTAVASSCMRCHAEDLYKLSSTVTWKGKHEGWRLLNEWRIQKK